MCTVPSCPVHTRGSSQGPCACSAGGIQGTGRASSLSAPAPVVSGGRLWENLAVPFTGVLPRDALSRDSHCHLWHLCPCSLYIPPTSAPPRWLHLDDVTQEAAGTTVGISIASGRHSQPWLPCGGPLPPELVFSYSGTPWCTGHMYRAPCSLSSSSRQMRPRRPWMRPRLWLRRWDETQVVAARMVAAEMEHGLYSR